MRLPTIPPAEPSETSQGEPTAAPDVEPSHTEHSAPSYSEPITPSYGQRSAAFIDEPTPPELPRLGPFPSAATEPRPQDDNRKLIITFSAVCAGLLAILLLVLIYAFFIHKDDTIQIGAQDTPTTAPSEPATTAPSSAETTTEATETESPTASAGAEASDGPLSFTVHGYEVGDSVTSPDAPVEKTAQGDFVAVHMTVTNTSDAPATFLGTLQTLNAAGTVYNIDDEASFYLGGGLAELNPGDSVDVSVAFDVPPGTVPESIDLHGDPGSAGVQVPLA